MRARRVVHTMTAVIALGFTVIVWSPGAAGAAEAPVDLGDADSYAVLAGSTVTNTGPTEIRGDLGVSPGSAVTGFPPGEVQDGSIHTADGHAEDAKDDLVTAYNDAAGRPTTDNINADLGGQTLVPGVYEGGGLSVTGTLTLDAEGDSDAVFIFKASSTLVTASGSNISLTGDADACNVFWQVTSSATLGTNSDFVGTIMALTSITANTGASVEGRLLARNGAVTLDTNDVEVTGCAAQVPTSTTTTSTSTSTTSTTSTSTTSTSTTSTSTTSTTSTTAAPMTTSTPDGSAPAPGPGTGGPDDTPTPPQGGPGAVPDGPVPGGDSSVELPRTGSTLNAIALAGFVAVAIGAAMLRSSRQRPSPSSP